MGPSVERVSFCRICAASCGIRVTVDGDRVLTVRGDADHPNSRGYTCSKGRGLAAWHHSSRRLDRPTVRGEPATWEDLLDDLGGRLGRIRDGHGADAIGLYLATGLAYDAAGQVATATFFRSLGSSAFYSAATVDNAPVLAAAEMVAGHPMLNPVWNPAAAGLLLLVGTNPVVSHGYGTTLPDPVRHLRDFRARGGRIWVLDPRRTETAFAADEHLSVRPGSDVTVLAALVRSLLRNGGDRSELDRWCAEDDVEALRVAVEPFTLERAAAVAGAPIGALERLTADVRGCGHRMAVFCGTGTTMSTDGVLTEWLRWALLVITGSLDRPGGMVFHDGLSRPAPARPDAAVPAGPASRPELPRLAGQLPVVALADEIEAGNLRALVVTGGNPITAAPEPDRMRAALRSLDVLAVVDVMDGEMTDVATHVLPAVGQLERADVMMVVPVSVRSALQSTRPIVDPVADRKPVWWMLGGLARRLGFELLGGADPDDLTDELFLHGVLGATGHDPSAVFEAGPHGLEQPIEHGWVHRTMLPGGRWGIAPAAMLERLAQHEPPDAAADPVMTPRREMGWSNSVRYGGPGGESVVRISPDTAASVAGGGVGDGDMVVVASEHGSIEATCSIDPHVRDGVVSITHARFEAVSGSLTSSTAGVDPITTMPRASGVPVRLSRSRGTIDAPSGASGRPD